jgi:WD40 repeat protein
VRQPQGLKQFSGHGSGVTRIVWCRDNRHFVSIDSRFDIRAWDITRAGAITSLQPNPGTYSSSNAAVAISGDAKLVAYASGGDPSFAYIFESASGAELAKWKLPAGFERLASLGDDIFVLVHEEHEATTHALQSVAYALAVGKPLRRERVIRTSQEGDAGLFDHGLTPDGRLFWWVGPVEPSDHRRRMEIREVATGRLVARVSPLVTVLQSGPTVSLSSDGRYLFAETDNKRDVYDLVKGGAPDHSDVRIEAMSSGARVLVIHHWPAGASAIYKLGLRNKGQDKDWLEIENSDRGQLVPLAFSPDDRYLAWGSPSGTITVADLPLLQEQVEDFQKRLRQHPSKER